MRVAIAHDYLTQRGGAERVVLSLARAFPDATVHTLLYDPASTYPEFADLKVETSLLDRLRFVREDHRRGLPLYPMASKLMSIDADVIVASTSGWAHGFGRVPSAKVIAYCHNPPRWLYQADEYLGADSGIVQRIGLRSVRRGLRRWDQAASRQVDRYLANSRVVSNRIEQVYGLHSVVLPPPIRSLIGAADQRPPSISHDIGPFLLCVSRLLPYKNVDRVIAAAEACGRTLVVVGRGPDYERLARRASARVRFLSDLQESELLWLYRNCSCLVAASYEDFGLTPLEAAREGKPVAVLNAGGFLDTVIEGVTGRFFRSLDAGEIAGTIEMVMSESWNASDIRARYEEFSEASFIEKIRAEVVDLMGPE